MALTVSHQDLKSFFGEEDHLDLSKKVSFSEMVFRLLSEKSPSLGQLGIFDLILNLSIDHGPDTPSAKEVIEKAKEGESLSKALAEGIEEINDTHGGAGEGAMKVFYTIAEGQTTPAEFVKKCLKSDIKIPGYGHRLYKDKDPRAMLILEKLSSDLEESKTFVEIATTIQEELNSQSGKKLPLNIDGAIAVALCSFGWQPILGKAVFIIARTPGLVAHFIENAHINNTEH